MLKGVIKKLVALILILTLLFCNFSLDAFAKEETITLNLETYLSAAPEPRMSHDVELAASINTQLKNFAKKVNVYNFKLTSTEENIQKIINILSFELPECFHISDTLNISSLGNYISAIIPEYVYTKQQYNAMLAECEFAADKMLRGIEGNTNLGDVEKILLLHDRIALECEYDYEGEYSQNSHSMYGVFVNKFAVCQGYAIAYSYLLDRIGIENYFCNSKTLNHVWNIVYVNGKPYHVDITWDDNPYDVTGRVDHENFLVSTEKLIQNGHYGEDEQGNAFIDYEDYPISTTYDDYFWQNVDAAFVLLNDEIYYTDGELQIFDYYATQTVYIKRYSDNKILYETEHYWMANDTHFYTGNYSRLSVCGSKLLFSLSDGIYTLNPKDNAVNQMFSKPNVDGTFNIYGFTYNDGMLIYDLTTSPYFSVDTKKKNEYKIPYHDAGNINNDGYIDLSDVRMLAQNFAGWQVDVNESALDVNGDEKTNLNDLVHLAQYIAGWDGIVLH